MTHLNEKNESDHIFWEEYPNFHENGDLDDLIFSEEEYNGPSSR